MQIVWSEIVGCNIANPFFSLQTWLIKGHNLILTAGLSLLASFTSEFNEAYFVTDLQYVSDRFLIDWE